MKSIPNPNTAPSDRLHEQPGFDTKREEYVRLDPDAWLRDHGIREEGRQRGEKNHPPSDKDEPDDIHYKVLSWINGRGRRCRDDVAQLLRDFDLQLNEVMDDHELTVTEQKVTEIANDGRISIDRRVEHDRTELTRLETAVRQGTSEYEKFRKRAGLDRLPDYSGRQNAALIIILCALIEIGLNASLLRAKRPHRPSLPGS